MNVEQVMTRDVTACRPEDSLVRAAQIMWEHDRGCVPVLDGGGRVVAVITDRDVCMAAYTRGLPLRDMSVGSAASRRLISVVAGDEVATAEQLMREYQIRRLPVVDSAGKLLGMLSTTDLARRARDGHRFEELSAEGVVKTLAAICTPRPRTDGRA